MITPTYEGFETCERCHRPVEPTKAVWFELNSKTGEYVKVGSTYLPVEDSQGCFAFGPDCAKAVEKAPSDWQYIGLAARNRE